MIMVPLKLIKSKLADMKMKHDQIDIFIFQIKCLKHHFKLKRKVNKTRVLMNSKTGKMSSIALKLNFKFNLT